MSNIRKDVDNAKVVEVVNDHYGTIYGFQEFSFGERGVFLTPETIMEIVNRSVEMIACYYADAKCIITIEPGGNPWGLVLSYCLGLPLYIVRKVNTQADNTDTIVCNKGYEQVCYLVPEIETEGSAVLFDDVISTGSTLRTIVTALNNKNIPIIGILAIYSKDRQHLEISKHYGMRVICLEE